MRVSEFGNCCTARIIEDFGYDQEKNDLKREFLSCCRELNTDEGKDYYGDMRGEHEDLRNLGLIFATTTTEQTKASEFLKQVGFHRCGRPAKKGRHSDTKLIGWYICSSALYKWWQTNKN